MTLSDILLKVHLMAVVTGAVLCLSFHQNYVAGLDNDVCRQATFDMKCLKCKYCKINNRNFGVSKKLDEKKKR